MIGASESFEKKSEKADASALQISRSSAARSEAYPEAMLGVKKVGVEVSLIIFCV